MTWSKALGMTGISKSQVSALCQDIDTRVLSFLERPLDGEWPYLWLDATYIKVRQNGRIVSIAAIIATGVNQDGRREILGLGLGQSEAATFWIEFLRGLVAGIDAPRGFQPRERLLVHRQPRRLPLLAVRLQAEPREVLADRVDEPLLAARRVGIVDPQQEAPAGLAREQPVVQRGAQVADMQSPGGRRGKAGGDGHAVAIGDLARGESG